MIQLPAPISRVEVRRVEIASETTTVDFNALIINPNAKVATIELELYKGGVLDVVSPESISGEEFKRYTEQDPETAPLFAEAVKATRRAWIAILQKQGRLPAGEIVDNWP